MFDPRDLRKVEAGQLRELAASEARVLADLAEAAAKCLLGALSVTGHESNCRLSRGPGLLLVDAVSAGWGWQFSPDMGGKTVWALLG